MTTTQPTHTPTPEPYDVRAVRADAHLAVAATGLLREFNDAGVLGLADVHLAQRLGRLGGESDERVLLAVALLSRAVRGGSVVLRVADAAQTTTLEDAEASPTDLSSLPWPEPAAWAAAVAASPLVGDGAPPATSSGAASPDAPVTERSAPSPPQGDDRGAASPIGTRPSLTPLRLHEGTLWLDRYWQDEQRVANHLLSRAARPLDSDAEQVRKVLDRLWPDERAADQRAATEAALRRRVSVICGGPGTGKTTTVARLLAALLSTAPPDRPVRWALAAPTGKAAGRLQEAVREAPHDAASQGVLIPAETAALEEATASTLHRLLQLRPGRPPGRSARDPLPHDVVIVDEASMVSLTLMARLLEALRPDARLVLVGDPDQLASVEAGAVLADISDRVRHAALGIADQPAEGLPVPGSDSAGTATTPSVPASDPAEPPEDTDTPGARLREGIVLLRRVHRFGEESGIALLADAVRRGDPDAVLSLLWDGPGDLTWYETGDDDLVHGAARDHVQREATALGVRLAELAGWSGGHVDPRQTDGPAAVAALGEWRLLCAHRNGPRGVSWWNHAAAAWTVEAARLQPRRDGRYPGQPLLVTVNDPGSGLMNGDTGVVVTGPDGDLAVAVENRADPLPLGRLPDVRPLYAGTVHKSQGSQLRAVTVMLPPPTSPLATRQMLYTAVTRAREHVTVIGSRASVVTAVTRPATRATGLAARLA